MGNHQRWNKSIEKMFEHRNLRSWNQRVYKLHKEDYKDNNESAIGQGFSVLQISENLYNNIENQIKNIEFLHAKLLSFWSSPGHFFDKGIGYCAVYNHHIVSVCFSGFVVGNVHGIDIETVESQRGKGAAQQVAHKFVRVCLENDIVPYWDCMELNKPSIAVAENLGFTHVLNYTGYYFSLG
jgi:RimJ/RimL family protein N-acetyltransferase